MRKQKLDAYKTKLDAQSELKGAKRKAGVLAAAGQLTAGGISGLGEEKPSVEIVVTSLQSLKNGKRNIEPKRLTYVIKLMNFLQSTPTSVKSSSGNTSSGKAVGATSDDKSYFYEAYD